MLDTIDSAERKGVQLFEIHPRNLTLQGWSLEARPIDSVGICLLAPAEVRRSEVSYSIILLHLSITLLHE